MKSYFFRILEGSLYKTMRLQTLSCSEMHSFHRCLSVHRGQRCLPHTPPWHTSPLGRHPPGQTPPPTEQTLPLGRHPLGRHPLGRHPRPMPSAYWDTGQQAGSRHPTGMHSCSGLILSILQDVCITNTLQGTDLTAQKPHPLHACTCA